MDSKLERVFRAERCKEFGNFHFKNGNYEAAIIAYLEGLHFIPDHLLLHCNVAQTYIKLKKFRDAAAHASVAIEIDPTYWKGYARLAKAFYELGEKIESHGVLMHGLMICEDKEELKKCFIHIPATSNDKVSAKSAKKVKKILSEELKKNSPEKKCQKHSDKKMDKNQNTVKETAPDTPSTKAKSTSQKKPVDFQDIKNDQFLAFAEKTTNERFSGQRKEFEKLLEDGYAAAHKEKFTKALECYKKALKIMEEVPLKYLGLQDKQSIVLSYIHNLMKIRTNTYENLLQTINDLKTIDEAGQFRILPAFYYIRSLAYFKMNRFKAALEELQSCNELISLGFPFIELCWPSTNVVVKETTKEGLQDAVNDLIKQAKSCLQKVPTAICRYGQCHEVSSHILPSELIFITDPDFVGYVTVTCEEKCHVQYHLQCWKVYRDRQSEFEKIADKDMLGKPCPTTDCLNSGGSHSTIVMVEIYDQFGAIKTQMKACPATAAAKQQSKKKKEDCKSVDEKKDKEKASKARKPTQRKSQSDKKSVEPKSSLIPKKESEEIFNAKIGQLINLRAVNFGCTSSSWNPNEAFYGRSDEKELCNLFELKRVDNPLFVPDQNDKQTVIRMNFYKLLRKETFLSIDQIEEHWNDDDEFSSEIRNCLNGKSIVEFLVQSTLFTLLDDVVCTSENLPEAYKETEVSLEQSVAFMIEGFTETAKKNKNMDEATESQKNKGENNEQSNALDGDNDEEDDDEEVESEYDSESSEGSEGECSEYYESTDNEECQSELEVENEELADLDQSRNHKEDSKDDCPVVSAVVAIESNCPTKSPAKNEKCSDEVLDAGEMPESEEFRKLCYKCNDEGSKKIFHEQSVQTENDEENSEKNVIENLKKKMEIFNEKLTEKSNKISSLEAELSKSNALNQKIEAENAKLLDQKEKLNKKLTNQAVLHQKKEAALIKETEQLKTEGQLCRDKLAVLENQVEKLVEKFKKQESDYGEDKLRLEQSLCNLGKDNEQLKLNHSKIKMKAYEATLELFEKRCMENILDLEILSAISSLSCVNRIKITDSLMKWNRFKLKLNEAKSTMMTHGNNCDVNDLIDSVQREEPQRIPFYSIFRKSDFSNTPDTIENANIGPERSSTPVDTNKNESRKTVITPIDETVFVGAASAQIDDDDSFHNHSIDVLPNLPRPESSQYAYGNGNSNEPSPVLSSTHSKSGAVHNDGVWEVTGKHSNRMKPDVVPTSSTVKKRQFTVLKEKLQLQYPDKTENELEECIRTVRARNNNSLTGLRLNEIEYRVGKLLEERSKKPSTMGLEKFGKVGWCQNKPVENIWSGSIELEDCIICSEGIDQRNLTTLDCYHYFHTECIRKWLKEKSICPLCTTFTKMPDEFPAL